MWQCNKNYTMQQNSIQLSQCYLILAIDMIYFYTVRETQGKGPKSYKKSPKLCFTKTEVAKMPRLKSHELILIGDSNQTA